RDQQVQLERFIVDQQRKKELPLYLHVLAGVGAFVASLCFTGSLSAAGVFDFGSSGLIWWGISFITGAVLLAKAAGAENHTIKYSFLIQTSLCLMGVGKILFVMGGAKTFEAIGRWNAPLALLTATLATYHLFGMSIDRFASSLAVLI